MDALKANLTVLSQRNLWHNLRLAGVIAVAMCFGFGCLSPVFGQEKPKSSDKPAKAAKATRSGKKSSKGEPAVPVRRVLVFPAETKGGSSDNLVDIILDVEQSRLSISRKYTSQKFQASSLLLIKRALLDKTLSEKDLEPPFDSVPRLKRLSEIAGYNLVLASSIDDYKYEQDKERLNLTISVRLIDFLPEKPKIRTVQDTLQTKEHSIKSEKDLSALENATRDLIERIMKELTSEEDSAKKAAKPTEPLAK